MLWKLTKPFVNGRSIEMKNIFYPSRQAIIAALVSIPATCFLTPTSVRAGGSIALSDLQELTRQSPKLTKQIKGAIQRENKGKEDIICVGGRVGGKYALGGARYAPFECRFTKLQQVLIINAKNRVKLINGKLIPLEKLPDLSPQPEDAKLIMKLTNWKWMRLDRDR
jgi:hypothetical protein